MNTPAAQRRSLLPLVLGVLALLFSSVGLLSAIGVTVDWNEGAEHISLSDAGWYGVWIPLAMGLALVLFAVHLCSGLLMILYKPSAPAWMTAYGVGALSLVFADILVAVRVLRSEYADVLEEGTTARLGVALIAIGWPIAVLVLANLKRTRAACSAPRETSPALDSGADALEKNEVSPAQVANEDADFAALCLNPAMKAAGVSALASGVVALLLGFQTYGATRSTPTTLAVVLTLFVAGVGGVFLGAMQLRVRGWASLVSVWAFGVVFVLAATWLVFSLMHGLLSLLALVLPPLSVVATVTAKAAIPHGKIADQARRRLEEQGLQTGN